MEILNNPSDHTDISLIFCNTCEDDILLKDKLDFLAKTHKNFHVTYVLSNPYILPPAKRYAHAYKGFVTADIIAKHCPPAGTDNMIFVCGPPGMMRVVSGDKTPDYKQGPVDGFLKDLHFTEEMVYKF